MFTRSQYNCDQALFVTEQVRVEYSSLVLDHQKLIHFLC